MQGPPGLRAAHLFAPGAPVRPGTRVGGLKARPTRPRRDLFRKENNSLSLDEQLRGFSKDSNEKQKSNEINSNQISRDALDLPLRLQRPRVRRL